MDVRMKKVFLYIVVCLLLLGIPATIYVLGQQRNTRARAAPATTLSLTPPTQTVNTGTDNVKLNVDIDPGTNQVISAKIYLTYDPTKLEAKTITNGSSAPRVLNSGVIENGTASINVGAASNSQPITARGTIAVITFKALAPTGNIAAASVQFASNTFVGGLNEPTANVLIGTNPAKITITGAGTTGENFATGSATLTPTAGATPTATPTATLTLTPTLTPTIPATGSADATASASAVQILDPVQATDVTSSQPVISGTAPPGSTVTIVIHSDAGITATVTADTNGNWVYTPTTALDPGPHSVVASAQTAAGTTQTATTTFVVASGAGTDETSASASAMPVSGSVETTVLLLIVGILFMASGIFVWHF